MPIVKYGGKDGEALELVESDELIAVRTRSQKLIGTRSNVRDPIESELNGCDLMYQFPEAGVQIYRVPKGERRSAMETRKASLRAFPDVRFAGGVLTEAVSKSPVLYTENVYVRFKDSLHPSVCEATIRDAGFAIKEILSFAVNAYFIEATEGTGKNVFDMALNMLERDDVEVCHPELIRPRVRKAFFPDQWHLASTSINGMMINQHAHVDAAHAVSRGAGTIIAVIDDGFDVDHVEFSTPGKIVAPLDTVSRTSDPRPREFSDNHGTACAGVACASGVEGAVGVAPDARLMPIRSVANLGSMAEAHAFSWAADQGADVISCSWGPPDGAWFDESDPRHDASFPLPDSTRDAINHATTRGRGGLGCVILFAAGNGNESVENDGYASHDRTIAVAACNDRGRRSVYSDFGASVWCCFPSNDFGFPPLSHPEPLTPGIWTVDRSGGSGYNDGDPADGDESGHYTNAFGGTSSACPGAAGVCALVLSVNPDLAWTEVRDILRSASEQIDPGNGNYDGNGHSPFYGYGRINSMHAVQRAEVQPTDVIEIARSFATPIPDLGQASATLQVNETATLQEIAVSIDLVHTYVGDLHITLTSPGSTGKTITLQSGRGGSLQDLQRTFRSSLHDELATLRGVKVRGLWTLHVQDQAARDVGMIRGFGLQLTLAPSGAAVPGGSSKAARPQRIPKSRAAAKSGSAGKGQGRGKSKKRPAKRKTTR